MKKYSQPSTETTVKTGMPLSYFTKTEPFATWFGLVAKKKTKTKLKKGNPAQFEPLPEIDPVVPEEKDISWIENVFLEKFDTREISNGIFKGCYEMHLEFAAYQKVVIELLNPKGTAAIFGKETKNGEKPEKLKLKFVLDAKKGFWKQVQIYGDVRFRLSKNIVSRVIEVAYQWKKAPVEFVEIPLSGAKITLNRGAAPKLSHPVTVPNFSLRIAQSNLVAKISSLDLGGTFRKPKLVFNGIKLQTIIKH